jgi:hypothetical protein
MPWRSPEYEGEFPSLGWAVGEWIEEHCVIPDREFAGDPFVLTDEMWRFLVHHYRLRLDANPDSWETAWFYTRSMLVRPQKWGKSPFVAAMICAEAVGPVLFAGWDEEGEPVGRPWPTAIIQVTASTEDQTDNVYKALRPMIELGPLANIIPDTGETRINLPGGGWIEPVTSKALSRLGARITFAPQDEPGTWPAGSQLEKMADTQYRGLSGTGGRAALITNGWDLAENSVAQQLAEANEPDVFVDHMQAPASLSYTNKADRQRIHRIVYGDSALKLDRAGNRVSGWVNLDRIEADAAKLVKRDPNQAGRFFGNIPSMGSGAWLQEGQWEEKLLIRERPKSEPVCAGFDGSDVDDWTGIRLETFDLHQFTPLYHNDTRRTIWNPARWPGHRTPRAEVMAAWDHIFASYDVVRAYLDPPLYASEIAHLQGKYGDKVVIEWPTYRVKPMHAALERLKTDIINPDSGFTHDDCAFTALHVRNAVERARSGNTYILGKASDQQKIDLTMSSVLAHEAVSDAIAAGDLGKRKQPKVSTAMYGFN